MANNFKKVIDRMEWVQVAGAETQQTIDTLKAV